MEVISLPQEREGFMRGLIPFAILGLIWIERNDRIFKRMQSLVEEVVQLVFARIVRWASYVNEFEG